MSDIFRKLTLACFLTLWCSCSTSNGLKKFDEGDIKKVLPVELANKFEVKDVDVSSPAVKPEVQVATPKIKIAKRKLPRVNPSKNSVVEPVGPPKRRVEPLPFDTGEKLEYDIRYLGVTAGVFKLEVLPYKQLVDRKVYHFMASAKTVKIFELVYRVNDVIESFWDYEGLFSHKYTMDLDETKQNRKVIELYDYEKKKSFYWDRVNHIEKGISEKKESFDIQLWSQDPISMLFFFRTLNLPTHTEVESKFPVILDGKPLDCGFRYLKTEKVYAAGAYREANVFKLVTYQNGEPKNKENTVWLSTDEHHYILRIEAKVKVGSFAVALEKVI